MALGALRTLALMSSWIASVCDPGGCQKALISYVLPFIISESIMLGIPEGNMDSRTHHLEVIGGYVGELGPES